MRRKSGRRSANGAHQSERGATLQEIVRYGSEGCSAKKVRRCLCSKIDQFHTEGDRMTPLEKGSSVGLVIGAVLGLIVGAAVGNMGIGLIAGTLLGIVFGAGIAASKKDTPTTKRD